MPDIASLAFKADTSELVDARSKMEALGPAAVKAEKASKGVATAFDQTGVAARKATDALSGEAAAAGRASKATDALGASTSRARDAMGRYSKTANDNATATERLGLSSRKAANDVGFLGSALSKADAQIASTLRGTLALGAGMASIAGLSGALRGIVQTTVEFQKLENSLLTVTGSAKAAADAMSFARDFASRTPFDVQQVTQAFIRLKLLGLDPSADALTSFGNTASAMGRPLMQFIEAVSDAVTGENERLKEFGIKAAIEGKNVSYTFQGITTTIGNNATEIEAYLRKIGNTKFAGGMDREAKLLGGTFSNLGDAITNFQYAIGSAFTGEVQNAAGAMAEWLNANQSVAASLGSALGTAVKDVSNIINDVNFAIGHLTTKFQEAGRTVATVTAGIAASGPASMQAFMAGWDNFPELMQAVATAAFNAIVQAVERAINDNIDEVNRWLGFINTVRNAMGADPIELFARVDFAGSKREVIGAASDISRVFTETFAAEQAKNEKAITSLFTVPDNVGAELAGKYGAVGDAAAAAAPKIATAAGATSASASATDKAAKSAEKASASYAKQNVSLDESVSTIQRQIDALGASEGATAAAEFKARELANAWATAREAGKDFIPQSTLDAIDAASGKIETLTNKLGSLNEANAAVDEFFPLQKASREAERLNVILNDTSLNLSDVQKAALQLKIDKGFVDAQSAVDGFADKAITASQDVQQAFVDNLGSTLLDIFDAGGKGAESFGQRVIGAFASIGKQFADLGKDKLMTTLFGNRSGYTAGQQETGSRSVFSGGASAVADAAQSFAPSSVNRQTSNNLATAVTKSVSGNLLASVLGAGKSSSHISGLNKEFATSLTEMFKAAPASVQAVTKINSGFRSVARQAELFDAAVAKYGSVAAARKWVAPPGRSNHNGGQAADLGFGSSAARDWFHQNAGDYGMKFPMGHEPWHIEAASTRGGSNSAANARVMEKSVSTGVQMGIQKSNDNWAGLRSVTPGQESSGGLLGPRAQAGLSVAGAGIGAFSSGYQSGSPISGGLGGAMSGLGAASSIGTAFPALAGIAGPIGMIGGAALGILGGILGGKAEREKKHREAAANWEAQRPAYEAFDQSLSGEGTGQLRASINGMWDQLNSFMQVGGEAWKYGEGNSSAQFESTGTKMFAKWDAELVEFRDAFQFTLEDLSRGDGLEGAFTKGRAAVKSLDEQIKSFLDDVSIAFGSSDIGIPTSADYEASSKAWEESRNAAIEKAKQAAGAYALSMLYSADVTSDVQKAIDGFKGTAAGIVPVLERLGWSAEEAAAAVDEKLNQALGALGADFVDNFTREINSLSDKGYLNDVSDLIKARDTALSDAALLGVDPSVITNWFKLAAQDIINGAELTGTALTDLLAAFPELSGVVKSFTEDLASSAEEIKSRQLGYQNRAFDATNDSSTIGGALASFDRYAAQERQQEMEAGGAAILDLEAALAAERYNIIKDFAEREKEVLEEATDYLTNLTRNYKEYVDGLLAGADSPLSVKGRRDKAQSNFNEQYALALKGDRDAANGLTNYASDLIDAEKSYSGSSPAFQAMFDAITTKLLALPTQVSAEQFIVDAVNKNGAGMINETAAMKEALRTAFAAGPAATAAALSSAFTALDTSVNGLLDFNEMRSALSGIATDAQVRTMMNVLDANGDGQLSKLELLNAATATQNNTLNTQSTMLNAINVGTQSALGNAKALYGLITHHRDISLAQLQLMQQSNQRGYMSGGYTGNGSTSAVAGLVHGREYVFDADATAAIGRDNLDMMASGRMPMAARMMNDNREVVAELRQLREDIDRQTQATIDSGMMVRDGIDGVADANAGRVRRDRIAAGVGGRG